MTLLIQGHSTLKSTAIAFCSYGVVDVYRLTLAADGSYAVHLERRERNGSCGEMFLYQGTDLDAANHVYARYADPK